MTKFWQKIFTIYRRKPIQQPKEWLYWAQRLPRSAFIIWAAGQLANYLIENKSKNTSIEMLLYAVDECSSCGLQFEIEKFMEKYYFDFFDPHKDQCIRVFRKIVKRKIQKRILLEI